MITLEGLFLRIGAVFAAGDEDVGAGAKMGCFVTMKIFLVASQASRGDLLPYEIV